MDIEKAVEDFLQQQRANGRAQNTLDQYRRQLAAFVAWLKRERRTRSVALIDHKIVAAYVGSPAVLCRKDGRAKLPNSTNAVRGTLRVFFAYARDAGLADQNAARLVQRARCGLPPPKGLTDDEARRLMAVLEAGKGRVAERDHMLFALMLGTGLRVSSALALETRDVDLENGEVTVHEAKCSQRGRVFLGAALRALLARYLVGRPAGLLFAGYGGTRLCSRHVRERLELACAQAGIRRVACHALRHTLARRLLDATGDVTLVQKALLHRSITSTMVYCAVPDQRLRDALGA